jgi:hypothetical protein
MANVHVHICNHRRELDGSSADLTCNLQVRCGSVSRRTALVQNGAMFQVADGAPCMLMQCTIARTSAISLLIDRLVADRRALIHCIRMHQALSETFVKLSGLAEFHAGAIVTAIVPVGWAAASKAVQPTGTVAMNLAPA